MPTVEEIAYREGVRSLEGQAQDLENFRSHTAMALTGGGITAAFFGVQANGQGWAFVVAVIAFTVVVVGTVVMHVPRDFGWDFHAYDLVNDFVDVMPQPTGDWMMRELAVHTGEDYGKNRKVLDGLEIVQVVVLAALGIEVAALLLNLTLE